MGGAISPLLHTSSWCTHGKKLIYLYTALLLIRGLRIKCKKRKTKDATSLGSNDSA
jgi:hypothetical protein